VAGPWEIAGHRLATVATDPGLVFPAFLRQVRFTTLNFVMQSEAKDLVRSIVGTAANILRFARDDAFGLGLPFCWGRRLDRGSRWILGDLRSARPAVGRPRDNLGG